MPVTYPRTDVMGLAKLGAGSRWRLMGYQETARTGGGLFISSDLADPIWVADYATTGTMTHPEARTLYAALMDLEHKHELFTANPPDRLFPAAYPTGVFPGDGLDDGVIDNLTTDASYIRISGLPANFVITAGDMFRIDYGASDKYRAVHMAAESITASAAGLTVGGFTVTPPLRVGVAVGDIVRFKQPSVYMQVVPGSVQIDLIDKIFAQVRWQAVQVHAKP